MTLPLKANSHFALLSAFAFLKIIGAMVTKMQMQRMTSTPILCININVTIETVLKFDANADANIDFDAKC